MPKEKGNWQIKKTTVVLIAAAAFVILATILLPNQDIRPLRAAGEDIMNEVEGYWWAPNGGWISLNWDTVDDQDVQIDKSAIPRALFTGYAWGPNIGWISMQDMSGGNQYQVFLRENVNLKGSGPWPIDNYAWGPNIGWIDFDAIDAWDHNPHGSCPSWDPVHDPDCKISADEPQMKVNATVPEDADMAGYAWSPNFGWINLSFATVPGWRDTIPPALTYFDVQPENGWPDPQQAEKYSGHVYIDEYEYVTSEWTFPGDSEHLAWVQAGTAADSVDFKVEMRSVDQNTRWHDLNVSELITANSPPPDKYYWWDRLRFLPGDTPPFVGRIKSHEATSGLIPPDTYAEGANPEAVGNVEPPLWKSVSHLRAVAPTISPQVYEFRYNVRDAGGNRDCPAADFDWKTGKGCVLPLDLPGDSPMQGRAGLGIDDTVPSGLLSVGGTEISIDPGNPTLVSKMAGIDFTATYIDTDSGAYHVILNYSRQTGAGMWEPWEEGKREIGERRDNVGRVTEVWTIDDPANPDPGAEENPLDTSGWPDQQVFQLRLRIFDNVGNLRQRIFYAKVNDTPPEGDFTAYDPIDRDPNRTRYAATDLYLPPSSTIKKMQVANTPEDFDRGALFEPYPENGAWKEDWDMKIHGEDVTGGIKTVYANFCDGTVPKPVCTHDKPGKEVTAQIAAPWFEGAQGDVYGRSGVGTQSQQFAGIAPYYNVAGVKKYNATYRITSGGEVKPQITSAQGWTEGNYHAFGYPGINVIDTVAPIDFDDLKSKATTVTDSNVANDGGLDLGTDGIILLKSGSLLPNSDPVLYSNKSDRLVIKGRGTLLVEGNLRIINDLYYEDNPAVPDEPDEPDYNVIDSMAVLTSRANTGCRGNVYVGDNVAHLVGAYIVGLKDGCLLPADDIFGSGTFHSSVHFLAPSVPSPGKAKINPGLWPWELQPAGRELVVEGMVAARDFNLGRYSTGNQNFLTNGSLEGRPCSDWTCAGAGIFGTSGENVVAGDQKLQITLKPNQTATLSQNGILLGLSGKTSLTLSGYLRSNFKLVPKNVIKDVWVGNKSCLFQPDDKDIRIDSQWRRFQCTVSVDNGALPIGVTITAVNTMKPPPPIPPSFTLTLDLDAWQLEAGDKATEWHDKFAADTNYMASEKFVYDGRVIISTPPGLAATSGSTWEEGVAD